MSSYKESAEGRTGIARFFTFVGWFFRDDSGNPSMMRVFSLLNVCAGIVGAFILISHTNGGHIVNPYEFWIVVYLNASGLLGKGFQKIVEKAMELSKGKLPKV